MQKFKPGDRVDVGCFVDSCRTCEACQAQVEYYLKGFKATYGSESRDPGGLTFGGYSKNIVCDQNYVLRVPENLD